MSSPKPAADAERRLSQGEFVALMATLFATVAFATDAMLPAIPTMAADLTPEAPNRVQLIVTSFVFGMGLGTLFTGPLSDRFGRKPVVLVGAGLYVVSSLVGALAGSLEVMLAARVMQGVAAAAPRVVALAIIRDLYSGRQMARIMSFVMMVFTLIPAFAPTMGAGILAFSSWQGIYVAFALFCLIGATWLAVRQPETLPPEARRPFTLTKLTDGVREVLSHPVSARATLVQTLAFGVLFLTLSTVQPTFDQTFGEGHRFHLWFGLVALLSAGASLINASVVERLGMRRIVRMVFLAQIVLTSLYCLTLFAGVGGTLALALYVMWVVGLFAQVSLTVGNLNAMAMEPMGHLAGLAASVVGSIATVGSVIIAVPIGLAFNGTPIPAALGVLALVSLAFALMRQARDPDAG